MAITKVSRGLLSTGIVDNSNATAITIDSSENVIIGSGNSSITLSTWDANKSDISALTSSSDFGGLIEGGENGSLVLGIQDNDSSDGVYILSGSGNYMTDSTYDKVVFKASASGAITIDGILTTANDLTLDVAGTISLDSDSGGIYFKDGGTTIGEFINSSSDFMIKSAVQDKDILLKGNDNGSTITALALDMSSAGAATFNSTITATQSVFTGVVPITCTNNGNSDTYTQTAIYANQNNTSANLNNGLTVEMGRLSNASDAEVRNFTFAARGGQSSASINAEGLAFGGDTATDNRLDDYEEGTWNPADGSGAGLTPASLTHNRYTKVGRLVVACVRLVFPTTSNTSLAQYTLPFTADANAHSSATGGVCTEQNLNSDLVVTASINSTTKVLFRTNGVTALTNAQLSGKILRFTVTYMAA